MPKWNFWRKYVRQQWYPNQLGLLFFINWFTDFFIENLGTEDEINIKIKNNTST